MTQQLKQARKIRQDTKILLSDVEVLLRELKVLNGMNYD